MYHEKQVRELCALHAINNLLQRRAFTQQKLDDICRQLAPRCWLNPHRSPLGLGNYDVNVVMATLHQCGLDANWFDRRRSVTDIVLDRVEGFIVNRPSELCFGPIRLPVQRRHWLTVRRAPTDPAATLATSVDDPPYYNLDSKLAQPRRIGGRKELVGFLTEQLLTSDVELFVIVSQPVAAEGSWIKPSRDPKSDERPQGSPSLAHDG